MDYLGGCMLGLTARTKKICKSAILLFFSGLAVSVNLHAGEVNLEPSSIYKFRYGNDGLRASSAGELIAAYNQLHEVQFNECTRLQATDPTTCVKNTAGSPQPGNSGDPLKDTYNGEPAWFTVSVTVYTTNNVGIGEVGPMKSWTVQTHDEILSAHSCPENHSDVITESAGNQVHSCLLVEEKSCPSDGNPINIGTGEKFEKEVDFSSADGSLTLERVYINQASGWKIDLADSLTTLQPGERIATGSEYWMVNSYLLPCLDPAKPNCINEVKRLEPLRYFNTSSQPVTYLVQDRQRIRFDEVNGTFKTGDPLGVTMGLTKINPANVDGASWKLIRKNGDTAYYLANGKLQRVDFAKGGSLSYQYNGSLLHSKTDQSGRSLTYTYDTSQRLTAVTLPDGKMITYQYYGESENDYNFTFLKRVNWPNGESVGYIYSEPANILPYPRTQKELTGKLDSLGNRIGTYKYLAGRAVSTEGALGSFKRTVSHGMTYTTVTNGLNSTRIFYFDPLLPDGSRNVARTSQPAGSGCVASSNIIEYYPSSDLKISQIDFNGHKTLYAYDMVRRLETVRVEGISSDNSVNYLPAGTPLAAGVRKISTQWHSQRSVPIKTAEPRLLTTLVYNGDVDPFNGNAIAQCAPSSLQLLCHKIQQATIDASGAAGLSAELDPTIERREWLYTYNDRGQLLTQARALDAVAEETREYYEVTSATSYKGDLKKITNALGQHTDFTHYDANGRLLRVLDANGVETQYSYDLRGRLASQSVAGAAPTSHTYDLNGNRIQTVLPNGVVLTYRYDIAKRLIAIENILGDKINYEYDVESNLRFERVTNASGSIGYIKEHIYDALSREQNTVNSFGQSNTKLYDANGNITGKIDAKQQVTVQSFDALNQLKVNTDALDGKTDYSYDGQGRITQVKDARGNITSYAYNAFGDLLSQSSPDTGTTTFSYDAVGNRIGALDARAVQVQYSYDALNRLRFVKYPAASIENVTYSYDDTSSGNFGIGRLTGVINTGAGLAYSYNAQGFISQKIATINAVESTTQYVYDLAGNILSIVYPSGRVVNYTYDTAGRVQSVKTKETLLAAEQTIVEGVKYLPFGPASNYTFGNGLSHSASYDNDYRLTSIQVGGIFNRGYSYDPVDNIAGISNLLAGSKSQNFTYDAVNRLINANGIYGALAYTYDAVGNRTSEKTDSSTVHLNDTYSYSPTSNRLTSISKTSGGLPSGARSFNYDEAGNRIQGTGDDSKVQNYTFNKSNRLETAKVAGILAGTYTYNALGQRVSKTLPGGSKEIYHYDEAGQLIAVADAAGNSVREYIYMGNQLVSFVNIE